MSDVLDRRQTSAGVRKAKQERLQTRDSLKVAIRNERMEWDSGHDFLFVESSLAEDRRVSEEIDLFELPRWSETDPANVRRAAEIAVAQWQQAAIDYSLNGGPPARHLAVRLTQPQHVQTRGDYYVSRAYRGLWFSLLILALAWGVVSGIALATSALLSPSAVLMGFFAVLVLGATLFVAGSRDRIRRRNR
ncbi:MAG: hypothetical protein ACQEW8_04510 [Actinomycetota bacterium]